MKKILTALLASMLVLCLLAPALADTYGLGVQTSIGSSKAATAEADGKAQVNSTICALAVDAEGKISACLFDAAQTKVGFNAEGAITSDLTAENPSKQETGDAYGMRAASAIGKEWNEQADALAAFCIGKTLDEVMTGVAMVDGYATSEDVKAGCTMHVTDFLTALEKAYTMATK